MSKESSSTSLDIGNRIPVWDVLPCNAYLVSLLPLEDALRHVPGLGSDTDICGIFRFVAGGLLLWRQQQQRQQQQHPSTTETQNWNVRQSILGNRPFLGLCCLYAMDGLPIIFRWLVKHVPVQPTMVPDSTPTTNHRMITQIATQRREKLKQLWQSLWPLLRLALWIQLARSDADTDHHDKEGRIHCKPSPLHVLYAHRRWLQEQGMELWPIILEPILQSNRETRRWIRQLWQHGFVL